MKASKKVMWLYLIRCTLVYGGLLILVGLGDALLPVNYFYVFLCLTAVFLMSIFYLFLYRRSLSINIEGDSVTFTHGVILKRETRVKYKNIASYITLSTPLMKLMKLHNVNLKAQGARFLIFPLEDETLHTLITALDSFKEGKA